VTRVCPRCRKETGEMFCPACHVLTFPPKVAGAAPESAAGDTFEATIWQGPNRNRGVEIQTSLRDRYFSKSHDIVILQIEGRRTIARLGPQFWKKPSVIKKAVTDDGKDQLIKLFEKHHLLPPKQSMKEKGIVDTIIFEVVTPHEEFKLSVEERQETEEEKERR